MPTEKKERIRDALEIIRGVALGLAGYATTPAEKKEEILEAVEKIEHYLRDGSDHPQLSLF